MVKVKAKRFINFGKVNKKLLYFKEGEVKDLPNNEIYNELISRAIEDGFLEVVETDFKGENKEKNNKGNDNPNDDLKSVKEAVKNDKKQDNKEQKEENKKE